MILVEQLITELRN